MPRRLPIRARVSGASPPWPSGNWWLSAMLFRCGDHVAPERTAEQRHQKPLVPTHGAPAPSPDEARRRPPRIGQDFRKFSRGAGQDLTPASPILGTAARIPLDGDEHGPCPETTMPAGSSTPAGPRSNRTSPSVCRQCDSAYEGISHPTKYREGRLIACWQRFKMPPAHRFIGDAT